MTRLQAIRMVVENLKGDELIVHANGAISRESFHCADRKENFYMIGSMGLTSSIALGISLARPDETVVVLDGDGNIFMGLGNLALVGACQPRGFIHIVLDNQVYGTTGDQPTLSPHVPLAGIARACRYATATVVEDEKGLVSALNQVHKKQGPHFLQIKVSTDVPLAPGRIPYSAREIKERFMDGIGRS